MPKKLRRPTLDLQYEVLMAAMKARNHFTYVAAALEEAWENRTSNNCELIYEQFNNADTARWLRSSWDAMFLGVQPHGNESWLSRMVTNDPAYGDCASPIEPLTGMLRHPLTRGVCNISVEEQLFKRHYFHSAHTTLLNITYILLENSCKHTCRRRRKHPRNLLYDLGSAGYDISWSVRAKYASKYGREQIGRSRNASESEQDWVAGVMQARLQKTDSITAVSSSIPLFRSLYRRNCIEFDGIFAWEPPGPHAPNPLAWMERVPHADRHMVHFYNEFVNSTDDSALGVLKRTARPDDFVVFKLDIDSPATEEEILQRLLAEPELRSLIDEFIFEYHGSVEDTAVEAKNAGGGQSAGTVAHGMQMMGALRRYGIRAHFWV